MTVDNHNKPQAADAATLARGGSLSLIGGVAGALLSMALIFVVTWGLGAEDGGAFFEAIALFNIVAVTVTIGADTGLLRFTARSLAVENTIAPQRLLLIALVPVLVVGVGVAIAAYPLAPALGHSLGGDSHADSIETMIRVLAIFVPLGALNLALLGATRGHGTMLPTVAAERVGRPLIQLLLGGTAILAGVSAAWLAGAWATGVVFSFAAAAVWLRNLRRRHDSPNAVRTARPTQEVAYEFWAFTLPRALASMFRVGVLWLDVLLVGALISPRAAAIYTVATRLVQAGFLAVDAIGQAVEPMFSSLLSKGQQQRAHSLYQVATAWLVGLTWPLFLGVWIFAPAVLGLFGAEFKEAATVVAILAGSALVGSGFGPVDILLVMAGKSLWSFWNSATALATNVLLNLILIPPLGLEGAAWAWAASRVVANVLPLVEVRSMLGFHPLSKGWWTAATSAFATFGLIGIAMRAMFGTTIGVFAAYVAIAGLAYALAVWNWRHRLDLTAFAAMVGTGIGRSTDGVAT
ncbi:MAG: oligosaccharide flippase family protein [bacterium]|nr:oligosaccharide flippase family protein [bacterium]